MENTELKNGKCRAGMESKLADLLFDADAAPVAIREHIEQCAPCRAELNELKATMALLDTWEGPEPSPYFFTRLNAQMREERQAAPEGWFARLRARFAYGPSMHVRPIAAMALTVMLLVGGGAYLNVTQWDQPAAPLGQPAVVSDLQLLDNNAQLLDQMEAMSSPNPNGD
jgi:hypothetical protein